MTGSAAVAWELLLRRATVMLTVPAGTGKSLAEGTGFFIAPGHVATCAHVIAGPDEGAPARVRGRVVALDRDLVLETDPDRFFRDPASGLDLALLRVSDGPEDAGAVAVATSAAVRPHDVLWTFGHPAGRFRAGQHATFTYQGDSRRSLEEAFELPRVYGMPVGPGYSGSPVINTRTGGVCGMLSTSDKAGSAHLIPVSAIVARCPETPDRQSGMVLNRDWLAALTDEQLAAGGWPFPGPRLAGYLAAAAARAEDHPYPSVLPGVRLPPLSQVYVHHHAHRYSPHQLPDQEGPVPRAQVPADVAPSAQAVTADVLSADRDVVLIGGPGAGKSSLLRTGLIGVAGQLLARRQTGEAGNCSGAGVPVRVLASELTRRAPLAAQIAASVKADLGGRLRADLPDAFFGQPPLPGERWLVLVDGLDEILDPGQRNDVLAVLRDHRSGPYRFVVTSRPVGGTELAGLLGPQVNAFELLPFDAAQLTDLAHGWYSAAGVPEPEQAARRFMTQAANMRPPDLVRSPLLATMLCQLFIADQRRLLPAGRYGLYKEFVGLLGERSYASGPAGVVAQTEAALQPFGAAPGAAGEVARRVFGALPRLARVRLTTVDDRPAAAIMAAWTEDLRPPAMRPAGWEELVRAILRRSGLLTDRADDLVFVHQTFTEFLTAQAIAEDPVASQAEYRQLFGRHRTRAPAEHELVSYALFLIAAWQADPGSRRQLEKTLRALATRWRHPSVKLYLIAEWRAPSPRSAHRYGRRIYEQSLYRELVSRRDLANETVIATIAADGVPIADDVIASAADGLARVVADPKLHTRFRLEAGKALAGLGDPRGPEQLFKVISSGSSVTGFFRTEAALTLGRLGDPRGVAALTATVADTGHWLGDRIRAARALAELGDPHGAEHLIRLYSNPGATGFNRIGAAVALNELGDSRGAELLAELASDPRLDREWQTAIDVLVRLRLPRYLEILETLATPSKPYESGDDRYFRFRAAEALAQLDARRGLEQLAAIAADPGAGRGLRRTAEQALKRLRPDQP